VVVVVAVAVALAVVLARGENERLGLERVARPLDPSRVAPHATCPTRFTCMVVNTRARIPTNCKKFVARDSCPVCPCLKLASTCGTRPTMPPALETMGRYLSRSAGM
jgi:hypothetical protein